MKSRRYNAIAYERRGPVSDMFVPRAVTISLAPRRALRLPAITAAALLALSVPTFFLPGGTVSFFSDIEHSVGDTFSAAALDLAVSPDHATSTLFLGQPGDTFVFTAAPIGSLPLRYKVTGTTSGNATFCAAIRASALAPLAYSGSIVSFSAGDTGSFAPWPLTLSLPSPAPGVVDGQVCVLDLAFDAYQEGGAPGTEYHATKHVLLTLTADPPMIVAMPASALEILPLENPTAGADAPAATTTAAVAPPAETPPDLPSSADTTAAETPPTAETPLADIPPPSPDAPAQEF